MGFGFPQAAVKKKRPQGHPQQVSQLAQLPQSWSWEHSKISKTFAYPLKKKLEAVNGEFCLKNPVKKHQFDTQTRCYLNIPRLFRS